MEESIEDLPAPKMPEDFLSDVCTGAGPNTKYIPHQFITKNLRMQWAEWLLAMAGVHIVHMSEKDICQADLCLDVVQILNSDAFYQIYNERQSLDSRV